MDLGTSIEAVITSSVNTISQVKLINISPICKAQSQRINGPCLAKLQPSEAHFLDGTCCNRIEEVSLIDVDLIVDPIDKGGVDSILQILEGFKVGNLSKSDEVIVEEIYPAGRCSPIFYYPDSDCLRVYASEVNGGHVC